MSVRVIDRSAPAYALMYQGAKEGVSAGAMIIATETQRLMSLKGPGVRSLPGEPPAIQTGHLRRSVQIELVETPGKIMAKVGPTAAYGPPLEFGTSKMAPRPALRPAIDSKGQEATQAVRDRLARAVERIPRAS